jgi:hypothetical protein
LSKRRRHFYFISVNYWKFHKNLKYFSITFSKFQRTKERLSDLGGKSSAEFFYYGHINLPAKSRPNSRKFKFDRKKKKFVVVWKSSIVFRMEMAEDDKDESPPKAAGASPEKAETSAEKSEAKMPAKSPTKSPSKRISHRPKKVVDYIALQGGDTDIKIESDELTDDAIEIVEVVRKAPVKRKATSSPKAGKTSKMIRYNEHFFIIFCVFSIVGILFFCRAEEIVTDGRCGHCPGCKRKPCSECSFCKNGDTGHCIDMYCVNSREGRSQREAAREAYLVSLGKARLGDSGEVDPDGLDFSRNQNLTVNEQVDMIMSQLGAAQKTRKPRNSANISPTTAVPKKPIVKDPLKTLVKTGPKASSGVYGGSSKAAKSRRCGECEGCMRDDCGQCAACSDKPRFGGRGTKKKACIARYCRMRKLQEDHAQTIPLNSPDALKNAHKQNPQQFPQRSVGAVADEDEDEDEDADADADADADEQHVVEDAILQDD